MDFLMPYFMTNKDWYELDENGMVKMKNTAPREALVSYEEFKKYSCGSLDIEELDENDFLIYRPDLQEQNEFEENKGIFGL